MTNGDKIRAMDNGNIAKQMAQCGMCEHRSLLFCDGKCAENILAWLDSEVTDAKI